MRQYVNEVLSSNRLSYGKFSKQLEADFADLHNVSFGVLSNSGTSSLLVSLQALKELHDWHNGDEVIVPALTFVATVNIVLQCQLRPILVDVEPDYYCLNPDLIKTTKRTRAIIPVHLFGLPASMTELKMIASLERLKVIEDSCEAVLAENYGLPVGSFGHISCFSFYNAHHLTAGIGGISITSNRNYALKMRSLVNHGLEYEQLSKTTEYDPMMLSRHFRFNSIGHSFRITELEAAIGLAQLETLKNDIKKRRTNARIFTEALKELEDKEYIQLPKTRPQSTHSFFCYPVMVNTETKYGLMKHLTDNGIGVRDMMPLTNQPAYKGLFNPADYPVANRINEHGLYWGCHQYLKSNEIEYIIERVWEYFE